MMPKVRTRLYEARGSHTHSRPFHGASEPSQGSRLQWREGQGGQWEQASPGRREAITVRGSEQRRALSLVPLERNGRRGGEGVSSCGAGGRRGWGQGVLEARLQDSLTDGLWSMGGEAKGRGLGLRHPRCHPLRGRGWRDHRTSGEESTNCSVWWVSGKHPRLGFLEESPRGESAQVMVARGEGLSGEGVGC